MKPPTTPQPSPEAETEPVYSDRERIACLREQAARSRRLADATPDGALATRLRHIADEFEREALAIGGNS